MTTPIYFSSGLTAALGSPPKGWTEDDKDFARRRPPDAGMGSIGVSTAMADGDEIEVKAAVGLNVLVFRQWEEQLIESVEEQPLDRKKLESMPGITVYIVKAGDTLWDIAKKFYTTVDEISGVNSLTEKEVKPGQSLILVRQG